MDFNNDPPVKNVLTPWTNEKNCIRKESDFPLQTNIYCSEYSNNGWLPTTTNSATRKCKTENIGTITSNTLCCQLGINKTKKNILKTILLLTGYLSCYVSEIILVNKQYHRCSDKWLVVPTKELHNSVQLVETQHNIFFFNHICYIEKLKTRLFVFF